LQFVEVLELGFEFIEELGPYDRIVVLYSVQGVKPVSHVSDPSCNFISFDKGEGKGDLFDG
jgi:hypothetical protein